MSYALRWAPALVLGAGALAGSDLNPQQSLELEAPLQTSIPAEIAGYVGTDLEIPVGQRDVAGFSSYLMRTYQAGSEEDRHPWFSVYVGYYASQTQGRTIHSPKNCLPGSGWEALTDRDATISLPDGTSVTVNRYVLQREREQALVLYWYQGRGRVEHDEYRVKYDLLRDAALRNRSDEALVRIVVPIRDTEEDAFKLAREAARSLVPAVYEAVPGA